MTLAARLKAQWSSEIPPNDGVDEKALREFEIRYGVRIPPDMRGYLLETDGMGSRDYWRVEPLCFWPLNEICSVSEEFDRQFLEEQTSYFVFADHLIEAPAYAIRLNSTGEGPHLVLAIWPGNQDYGVTVVATSFADFVERYLADEMSRWRLRNGEPREGFPGWLVKSSYAR